MTRRCPPPAPRLPAGPLLAWCRLLDVSVVQLADAAGVDRSGLQRSLPRGLTIRMADVCATKGLGMHPWHVWGDQWLHPDARADLARTRLAMRAPALFAQLRIRKAAS